MGKKKVFYASPPKYPFPTLRIYANRVNPFYRFKVAAYNRRRDSTFWHYAYMAGTAKRLVSGMARKEPVLVARERLKSGQAVSLTSMEQPGRKQRKAAKRAAKR